MATRRLSGIASSSSVPDNGGDHSGGGGSGGGVSDDVFSTYLYTGTQTTTDIKNGIDLAGEDGMVWLKSREEWKDHQLIRNDGGTLRNLSSNKTDAENANPALLAFNSDGFTLGDGSQANAVGKDYVSWTFRKQPGFFDIVTYTGTGSTQNISHNLGSVPGMIIVKCTSFARDWGVFHRSIGSGKRLVLNSTDAASNSSGYWNSTDPTDTQFTVGGAGDTNASGDTYVAYLFAHDDSDESIIKCGSYTTDGNEDATIDLGFEPQWLLVKRTDSNLASDWRIIDSMRGWEADGDAAYVEPNTTDAEAQTGDGRYYLTSTGFKQDNFGANRDYVYVAIRRPTKHASEFEPEELFAVEPLVNGWTSGFPVDMALERGVSSPNNTRVLSRMTDNKHLYTNLTRGENQPSTPTWDHMDGWDKDYVGIDESKISWMFRRAPGFFDVVAYDGTNGSSNIPHNLGVVPTMIWSKKRDGSQDWCVIHGQNESDMSNIVTGLSLNNSTAAQVVDQDYSSIYTASTFNPKFIKPSTNVGDGASTGKHIAYLFATAPGISKVGSYTGTGGDLDIDCGFTTGARFVLIKRTDDIGDWMYFDTERGITASDSPMLRLNENAAQASGSYIKPHSKGFTATSNLTSISGAKYLFYAIA